MTVANFALTGGANVAVGPTPVAVAVTGPTVIITNLGVVTCFGSCGGSAASALSLGNIVGSPAPAGNAPSSNGSAGIAIEGFPAPPVALATPGGGSGWLWLATIAGTTAVNVANGT